MKQKDMKYEAEKTAAMSTRDDDKELTAYPVKNRLPILAPEKSKLDEGRRRLTISKATTLSIDRTSSFFAVEMFVHSACSASTICSHSSRADERSLGKRWLKKVLMAAFSLSS
jgi:hypothetical protein